MATREFIQKRIEGKQREIAKLNAKLERISKAEATNWTVNPYGYYEHDKRCTLKDLKEAQKALDKYLDQLEEAEKKEASRNVPAITEFLNAWKARMTDFYLQRFAEYPEAQKKFDEDMKPYRIGYYEERKMRKEDPEEWAEWNRNKKALQAQWEAKFGFLNHYVDRVFNPETRCYDSWKLNTDKLEKDLQAEWERKYDFIIERTNEIVEQITDASNLEVGAKGNLNGYIIGTKGTAKVQTIGAGGYNIQCFHFRTLINRMNTVTNQPEKIKKVHNTSREYAGKTIEELKTILASLGGECKVYDNEKIYRMRLVMAIKKVD